MAMLAISFAEASLLNLIVLEPSLTGCWGLSPKFKELGDSVAGEPLERSFWPTPHFKDEEVESQRGSLREQDRGRLGLGAQHHGC